MPRPKRPTVVGEKFGRWTVISADDLIKKDGRRWTLCQCICGTVRRVMRSRLVNGDSLSCGCRTSPISGLIVSGNAQSNPPGVRVYLMGGRE